MPLSIQDPETGRLARDLSEATGESITTAVATVVRKRVRGARRGDDLLADLTAIAARCAALPELDARSAEELIGYDEAGLPV